MESTLSPVRPERASGRGAFVRALWWHSAAHGRAAAVTQKTVQVRLPSKSMEARMR